MSVYMVERELKGIAMEDLAAAQKAAIATAQAQGLCVPMLEGSLPGSGDEG